MSKCEVLKNAENWEFKDSTKKKVEIALQHYPEIDKVYIKLLSKQALITASVDADTHVIKFRRDINQTFVTIFHELMHIVQSENKEMSKTEECCSVYAMARMPPELVDGSLPYLGSNIEYGKLPLRCIEAVKYRESGGRDYLKFVTKRVWKPMKKLPEAKKK